MSGGWQTGSTRFSSVLIRLLISAERPLPDPFSIGVAGFWAFFYRTPPNSEFRLFKTWDGTVTIAPRYRSLFLLALLFPLAGCDEVSEVSARIKLVGTWQADLTEANIGSFGLETGDNSSPFKTIVNSVIKDAAKTVSSSVDAKETLELDHKGTFKVALTIQDKELSAASGTWKIAAVDGDNVTLSLKHDHKTDAEEITISLKEKEQITLPPILGATTSGTASYRRVK